MSAQDVVGVIESDPGAMRVLRATADLALPDWWIGAGFVRRRVWDAISNLPVSPERDVDVAYFDPKRLDSREDARAEAQAVVARRRGPVGQGSATPPRWCPTGRPTGAWLAGARRSM